jgi:hypothetical protein
MRGQGIKGGCDLDSLFSSGNRCKLTKISHSQVEGRGWIRNIIDANSATKIFANFGLLKIVPIFGSSEYVKRAQEVPA